MPAKRNKSKITGNSIYQGFKLNEIPKDCYYCGQPGTDVEHVIPYSYSGDNTPFVWACSECNGIASNKLFFNIDEKKEYIQTKLKVKYNKLLTMPIWSTEELAELGSVLQKDILASIRHKRIIEERINF